MKGSARCVRVLRGNMLLLLTLLCVVFGIAIGFAVRSTQPSKNVLMWIGLPGQLYLRLLKMMIVPLIVCSVITGTASLDPKANGRISIVSVTFIFLTNMLGALLGVTAFFVFKPGNDSGSLTKEGNIATKTIETPDVFADLLRNVIPDNLFEATFRQTLTAYEYSTSVNNTQNASLTIIGKSIGKTDGPNLLGLIFACTLVGIAASSLEKKGQIFLDFFEAASQIAIVMLRWFLWTTPLGMMSLIIVPVASIAEVSAIFHDLGLFIAAVTVALVIHQLVALPLILFILTRRNPYMHLLYVSRPWIIAFAAASVAVTIPEMLHSCEELLRMDKRIARFVIPFSVTLSANGSAVFIACSCLFLSNMSGTVISAGTVLIIGFLATVAAFAIPPVPSSSIVTIVMILTSLNVPVDAISLLLAVEFILDRLRTATNMLSHTICAAVTHHLCKDYISTVKDKAAGDDELEVKAIGEDLNLLTTKT